MSRNRTAQSPHPGRLLRHSNRKSQPDQYKDHRPTALPAAASEPRARTISHLALFFVRLDPISARE